MSFVFFWGGSSDVSAGAVRAFEDDGSGEAERFREGGLDGAAISLVVTGTLESAIFLP